MHGYHPKTYARSEEFYESRCQSGAAPPFMAAPPSRSGVISILILIIATRTVPGRIQISS